ncbi:DUF6954 family protein [Aneurinibacillus tyrosinisolvens]|uniref:DUF6954 family protein n=1 Tax=Aneurinibacillus tyrosinisolvens TaxID=1443435 RepID=UPI00063EDD5D|nr:hypothetical protein [Aneurinibacillus tyrosinisolvens]
MGKWILLLLFIPLYILVTFFGLGPIILADGSLEERIVTLLATAAIYGILTLILQLLLKRKN